MGVRRDSDETPTQPAAERALIIFNQPAYTRIALRGRLRLRRDLVARIDRSAARIRGYIRAPFPDAGPPPCHSKRTTNQDRRHHIPKQRHRVTNWAAYDIALRQRGSLTVWFTEAAIAGWKAEPRATRGGQPRYSALAITTALTLRTVFGLALRQTEGLIGSIVELLGLDLAVPDYST